MEKKPESIFINRELSWLDFDSRVLALAKEKTVPLGERIKFAAIFGSNMDEFFMVRVGSLYDQTLLKTNKTDNVTHMTAAEQINAITPRVAELQAKCDKYFQHLVSALAEQGYHKVDFTKLSKQQEHFWKTYFQRELLPLLSPQIVDSRHPFPFLNNKDIYYIAQLHSKNEGVSYGIVPVSSQFERVLFVKDGETACFAFVEELIAHYAATIFTASTVQKQCLFRVTRNADITVDEGMMDHDVDFRDVMSELLKKRRKLAAVRLQFWPEAPQEVVKFLRDKLVVPADRCYTQTSPLDAGALFKLAGRISGDSGHADLFYPAARPMQAPAGYDLYTEVRKHDVLLAYPYQSIRPFIKMLLRAAADPDVVSIKMTLYRMASDSQIVLSLIHISTTPTPISMTRACSSACSSPCSRNTTRASPSTTTTCAPARCLKTPSCWVRWSSAAVRTAPICSSRNPPMMYSAAAAPTLTSGRPLPSVSGQRSTPAAPPVQAAPAVPPSKTA